jgi:hypothetical protein
MQSPQATSTTLRFAFSGNAAGNLTTYEELPSISASGRRKGANVFKYEFMTQTQLGQLFGVTSHEIGKWLVEIGLRTDRKAPSHLAFDGDYVTQALGRNDCYNWVWHAGKTVAALEEAGHRRVPNPPPYLVDPPKLVGPFMTRENARNGIDVVNADGSVAIVVSGHRNAEFLVKVLNLADEKGVIARHFSKP